jgi:hypothetical protein
MKRLKRYRAILFLLAIQAFFAFRTQNFELHFFVWGLIWVACLANTTFELGRFSKAMDGAVASQRAYENQASAMAEITMDPKHHKQNSNDHGMKVIYGMLVLTNIVGYVITVMIVY